MYRRTMVPRCKQEKFICSCQTARQNTQSDEAPHRIVIISDASSRRDCRKRPSPTTPNSDNDSPGKSTSSHSTSQHRLSNQSTILEVANTRRPGMAMPAQGIPKSSNPYKPWKFRRMEPRMQATIRWGPVSRVEYLRFSLTQHCSRALRSFPAACRSFTASRSAEICWTFVLKAGTERLVIAWWQSSCVNGEYNSTI